MPSLSQEQRCRHGWARVVVVAGLSWPLHAAAGPDKIYWTDRADGCLSRANLDGSGQEILVDGLPGPQGIAIDAVAGRVYWSDSTLLRISSARLDGSDVQTVVDGAGAFVPVGLALDTAAGMLYWTDPVFGRIQRRPIDGGAIEDFQTGLNTPQDVSIDPVLGRAYWSAGTTGILYAPTGGGPPAPLVDAFTGSTSVVAQSPFPCQVVWRAADRLSRSDCLGIGVEDLLQSPGDVIGIAVDPTDGSIYWTDADAGEIRRLDEGAGAGVTVITGLAMPWRIALGPAIAPPIITTQPIGQVIEAGDVASFSVESVGRTPMDYAWLRDGQPLSDGPHVSGSMSPTLTITASAADVGLYRCVVSNPDGQAVTQDVPLAIRICVDAGNAPMGVASGSTPCLGDLDGDCDADIFDFALFAGGFGDSVSPGTSGDLDCDGVVTIFDFTVFSVQFGCGIGD